MPLLAMPRMLSPGRTAAPDIHGVEVDAADGGARQVEARAGDRALDDVAHLGDLAARDGDAGQPRALGEAGAEGFEHRRLRALDGDRVHEGDRPRRRRRSGR